MRDGFEVVCRLCDVAFVNFSKIFEDYCAETVSVYS